MSRKKYLSVYSNKLDLAEFFVKEWTRQKYAERLRHAWFVLYVSRTVLHVHGLPALTGIRLPPRT